jgi:uncharacterized protein (DUF433 family)
MEYDFSMQSDVITILENGGRRITGTRVSLDSVVHAYWNGQSVDTIVADFPSLNAAQVRNAIEYYLSNRPEVDQYLAEQDRRWEALKAQRTKKQDALIHRIFLTARSPSA